MFYNYTVVNLIDSYYTNAHEELQRHESDIKVEGRCNYALAMGAYRENLKYLVYEGTKVHNSPQ